MDGTKVNKCCKSKSCKSKCKCITFKFKLEAPFSRDLNVELSTKNITSIFIIKAGELKKQVNFFRSDITDNKVSYKYYNDSGSNQGVVDINENQDTYKLDLSTWVICRNNVGCGSTNIIIINNTGYDVSNLIYSFYQCGEVDVPTYTTNSNNPMNITNGKSSPNISVFSYNSNGLNSTIRYTISNNSGGITLELDGNTSSLFTTNNCDLTITLPQYQ